MRKLSDCASVNWTRDCSTRRNDVSAVHTISDANMAMANTKPTNRSFMLEFIARVYSSRIDYLRNLSFTNSRCINRAAQSLSEVPNAKSNWSSSFEAFSGFKLLSLDLQTLGALVSE